MNNENIKKYPLLVLRDMVVFPMLVVHLDVGRDISKNALKAATDKFIRRFDATEKLVAENGLDMPQLSIEELDVYWDKAKKQL